MINPSSPKARNGLPIIVILFVAATACAAARAQDTLGKIRDTGVITLGHRDAAIPFSYYDDKQQFVGYALDICYKLVDAIKAGLKLPKIDVRLNAVTAVTRFPLLVNGTIDLECGSTPNNPEHRKQAGFSITHFVSATRFVSRKEAGLTTVDDLKGKTVVSTAGTASIRLANRINLEKKLGMNIIAARNHAESFQMVASGRAAAFIMEDVLLHGLVANAKQPADWAFSTDELSVEPFGILLRRNDASFKKVVDGAMLELYRNGEIIRLYDKWFLKPIPQRDGKRVNLDMPMTAAFRKVVARPTDSGDPQDYR
jgi:glutamate/aspartate transport system substrate-binding protein